MIQTLSDALAERGYDTLTAVQQAVTAPELQQADLLVSAQTGSGKTVGFGLAIAPTLLGADDHLGPAEAPLALIVAPTRELALQVMRELSWLYAKAGARVVSCVGGMDMRDERRALERGAHIVVGTPGRLVDHIKRGSLDMSGLRAVVLDEADEMLDLGFREDLEFMLGEAPAERRTLMFSATVPPMIATLAQQYQRDAVRVTTLTGTSQHADIAYQALRVAEADAEHAIINVLRYHEAQNAIVFANTRAAVNRLAARFSNRGFPVVSLSGELSQNERTHALQAMRDGRARVCVATDVAARGIDLPNLELVIHADLPTNQETLLHRSGRTGRAGRKGVSALIVTPRTAKKAERLLKFAKIQAEWTTAPSAEEILRRDEERLLADPVWDADTTEEQDAFAAKLLELHAPEKIAAAYLRLYLSRQSAPEELGSPDAVAAPKERKPFGPSVWFALSVGRDDRAEPRWLLPLLCRAGRLDKETIGAIRVQQSETFVELAEPGVAGFLAALGEGGELEDGITVRQLDGVPETGPSPRSAAPRKPGGRPAGFDKPRGRAEARPRPAPEARPAPEVRPEPPVAAKAPRPPVETVAPVQAPQAQPPAAPRKPRVKTSAAPKTAKPAEASERMIVKPARKAGDKPKSPRPERPTGRPAPAKDRKSGSGTFRTDKPFDKPAGKFSGKPSGKSSGKPGGKPAGKPSGKFAGKPAGKPKSSRPDPTDTSKRFERPGKSGPSKPRQGGNEPPRRGKR